MQCQSRAADALRRKGKETEFDIIMTLRLGREESSQVEAAPAVVPSFNSDIAVGFSQPITLLP